MSPLSCEKAPLPVCFIAHFGLLQAARHVKSPMSTRLLVWMAAPSVAISLLLLALGGMGGWYVHHRQKSTSEDLDLDVRSIEAVEKLVFSIYEIRAELSDFRLSGDRTHLDFVAERSELTDVRLREAELLMNDEDEIVLVRQIRKGYEGFLREFQRLVPGKSGGTPAKDLGPRGGESLIEGMLIPAKKLLALEEGLVVDRSKSNERMADLVAFVLILLGTCGAAAGLVAGFGIVAA